MTINIKRSVLAAVALLIYLLSYTVAYAADPPVASNVVIDSGSTEINLTENTTTNVIVTATVTDATGCTDITGVTIKFYKTTTGAGSSDDHNNHYTVTTPTDVVQNSCVDLVATYTATIPVWYYADPAEWTAQVTPTDGTEGTPSTDTATINTLSALDVASTISYGSLGLGADTGTTDQTTTITNTGNLTISMMLSGYGSVEGDGKSMICSIGSINVSSQKYSIAASQDYSAAKTSLTTSPAVVTSFSISKTTTSTPSTGNIYWGLGMPPNGVGGSCSGLVVFTAI